MALRSGSHAALRAVLTLCFALPLVQACGGRSDTEEYLYGTEGPISVGGSSRGGSAAAGRPSVGGTTLGGGPGVAGTPSVGGGNPIGGTTGVAGMPTVGGTVGVAGTGQGGSTAGSAGMPNVGGAPNGPPISCGAEVCNADTQSCCAGFGGFQCVANGDTCQGAVLRCTDNKDCGMDVCCISITGDVSGASSCKPQCNTMGGTRDRQLCQVKEDCRMPFRFCTPTVFGVSICTRTGP